MGSNLFFLELYLEIPSYLEQRDMKITRTELQLEHQRGEFMTSPETYVHVRTRSPRNSIESFRGARSSGGCPQRPNALYCVT